MRDSKPITFRDLAPLPPSCGFDAPDDHELAYLAFVLSQRPLAAAVPGQALQIQAPPPPAPDFFAPK